MQRLRVLLARLRAVWRRSDRDRGLDDELCAFVDALAARLERQGMAPAEARRAALIEVEGVEQVKEAVRDARIGAGFAAAARDAQHGSRILWRSPGYSAVVVLTIALGIGANTAIFSVIHAVLLQPLPYPESDRLVAIEADVRVLPSAQALPGATLDLREQSRAVDNIALIEGRDVSIEIDGTMERVPGARASDDALPLLGAVPLELGRTLAVAEDRRGVDLLGVVISHELWQSRFHGDPDVVGRRFTVNNADVAVVGVTRRDLRVYVPSANYAQTHIDVWLPWEYSPDLLYRGVTMMGRLAPGATIERAQAEADGLAAAFVAAHPGVYPDGNLRLSIRPLAEVVARDARPALVALGVAVGFVLLIACINVANLMLARARTRERELAVRHALGATRRRLVCQLLAENVAIAALGGVSGVLLAAAGLRGLGWLRPVHLPRQAEIAVDSVVLWWSLGLTVAAGLFVSLVPALQVSRPSDVTPLNSGRAGSLMAHKRRWHRGLVVSQVALSIVPLVAAGLMLRTFANLMGAPLGFDAAAVVTAGAPLSLEGFPTVERRSAFYRDAIARVSALPGVEAVSVGGPVPFAPAQVTQRCWADGDSPDTGAIALQQSIMPGYFHVLGIPLLAGRDVSDEDIALERKVVVVDRRLASRLWPGNPVGRRLAISPTRSLEVIGVAGPIRARDVRDDDTPVIYVPYPIYEIEQTLVVRTSLPLGAIAPEIKRTVEALRPGRPVVDIRPLTDTFASSIDDTRFTMLVLSAFAAAALILAGIGLYGTLTYLISQRTPEFGVRVALGASGGTLLGLVVREGALLTGLGCAAGLAGAALTSRALAGLIYGVRPLDGLTLVGVMGLLVLTSFVAVAMPAWRASRVDPVTVLRGD